MDSSLLYRTGVSSPMSSSLSHLYQNLHRAEILLYFRVQRITGNHRQCHSGNSGSQE